MITMSSYNEFDIDEIKPDNYYLINDTCYGGELIICQGKNIKERLDDFKKEDDISLDIYELEEVDEYYLNESTSNFR